MPEGEEKKEVEVKGEDEEDDLTVVKVLTSGETFGEQALLNNKPRLATITCCKDSHFAYL